ncbi:hypothetical protein C2G38_2192788 [Gigaspora rosea]|uniref:Uncharacterized protein n=1 Tax=Gigaspora rosea TaxID=44941 RepID=A0A397V5R2_9GLOM|nr:hypothetical protein C2G38_2192788 [Gigaspora rosea]
MSNRGYYNAYGTECTSEEWSEYVKMPQVRTNETPSEWMKRIWLRLQYFRENDLLPIESKKYLEARRLIRFPDSTSYAPEIGIAICFSCDQLVYTNQRTTYMRNYNHIGMERHWSSSFTGNQFCDLNYEEYLKIKQKPNSIYNFNDEYALHRYGLWMQNAIRRIKRAREAGKKISACTIIQRKWLEIFYRPEGMCATQLAEHYKLLWAIREEMRQVRNV